MGCFARTCGLSGTGINMGEKVVVIVLNLPYKYIDLSTLCRYIRDQKDKFHTDKETTMHSERFMKAVLNKEIKDMKDYVIFDFKPVVSVFKGTYDDYGFIEEEERPEEDDNEYSNDSGLDNIIFHVWAVEFIFNKKIKDIKLDIAFALQLLYHCYFIRRSPIDWMIGQQHPDTSEMEQQIKLNERTNKYLKSKIERYKKMP